MPFYLGRQIPTSLDLYVGENEHFLAVAARLLLAFTQFIADFIVSFTGSLNRHDSIYFFSQGCYKAVEDLIISNVSIVVGVASGVLGLQILGIIFAFCLCKAIGNDRDRDYHYKY